MTGMVHGLLLNADARGGPVAMPTLRDERWLDPGGQYEIDWGHPLTAGLTFFEWFPGGLPSERVATRRGLPTPSTFGVGLGSSSGAGYVTYAHAFPTTGLYMPNGPASYCMVGRWDLAAGTYLSHVLGNANGAEVSWYRSGSSIRLFVDPGVGTTADLLIASSASNVPYVLGATVNAGVVAYVNGALAASGGGSDTTLNAYGVSIGLGCSGSGTAPVNGACNLFAVWGRALSSGEHAQLSANPFQMLRRVDVPATIEQVDPQVLTTLSGRRIVTPDGKPIALR